MSCVRNVILSIDGTAVGGLETAEFDSASERIETSNFGDIKYRTYCPGFIERTITGSGSVIPDETSGALKDAQLALWNAHDQQNEVTVSFKLDSGTTGATFEGSAWIDSISFSADFSNVIKFNIEMTINGALTSQPS